MKFSDIENLMHTLKTALPALEWEIADPFAAGWIGTCWVLVRHEGVPRDGEHEYQAFAGTAYGDDDDQITVVVGFRGEPHECPVTAARYALRSYAASMRHDQSPLTKTVGNTLRGLCEVLNAAPHDLFDGDVR
jgi:hypothetical protein